MSKAKILVVDDSIMASYHLQSTLEAEGYEVIGKCDSGEAALEFVSRTRPDLALMDIMLNGKLDGIETSGILKSKFNIPVIYITSLTDKDTIARAKVTEPYGYLAKPFEDREIFTTIEMALYKHNIESRLVETEERYFSTINSISDAVITINREYEITYMNPASIAMTQWVHTDGIGKPINLVLKLRNEVTEEININPLQCALHAGNSNAMPKDLTLIGKNGIMTPIGESSLSPMLDSKGNFVGLIIVFKNLSEKKEHENALLQMELQRKAAVIEGEEKERARIAKDLHDGLGQMLNAIKMNAKFIISDTRDAANLSRLLDEAIQESIRISENLLPAKLRDFDLATCLKTLCAQVRHSAKPNVSFLNQTTGLSLMSQSLKVNLYRIAQEAVNNSIKHSNASSIIVQLIETDEVIRLSIEDDGMGLPQKMTRRQNGLLNMRDRAQIMGGKLTLSSDEQRGTIVTVEVPTIKLLASV